MPPLPPRYAPATVYAACLLVLLGFEKMKQLLRKTNTSFLNFRPKLLTLQVPSWILFIYYAMWQVSELPLLWQFMLKYFFLFLSCFPFSLYQKTYKNFEYWQKVERLHARVHGSGVWWGGNAWDSSRFVLKWVWSCFKMAVFWMRSHTFFVSTTFLT